MHARAFITHTHTCTHHHIGRVFRFGQTQQLACIPNQIAYQRNERPRRREPERVPSAKRIKERKKRQQQQPAKPNKWHWNMFTFLALRALPIFFVILLRMCAVPNYMNYSGFWFNVFVINIFRIGMLSRSLARMFHFHPCHIFRILVRTRISYG